MDWEKLKEPFPAEMVEWRAQNSGEKDGKAWVMCLAYLQNRAIMDRLDEVFTPGGWQNEYKPGPVGGVVCGISVKIDGEWVCKWDGADNTNIEATKGGLSDSMKRAAVQWGIGRYLYKLEAGWGTVSKKGKYSGKIKPSGKWFKWDPPTLPTWALPLNSVKLKIHNKEQPKGHDEIIDIESLLPTVRTEIKLFFKEIKVTEPSRMLEILKKWKVTQSASGNVTNLNIDKMMGFYGQRPEYCDECHCYKDTGGKRKESQKQSGSGFNYYNIFLCSHENKEIEDAFTPEWCPKIK